MMGDGVKFLYIFIMKVIEKRKIKNIQLNL